MGPFAARIVVAALLSIGFAGCTGPDEIVVTAGEPLVVSGFGYDGRGITKARGTLDVRLAPGSDSGHARATFHDAIHNRTITFTGYEGALPYQSGGVAQEVDLWGGTGNGSAALPKTRVYLAAFGPVRATVDGEPDLDPRTARHTMIGVLFVTQGRYRDPQTWRIENQERMAPYDPAKPDDVYINRIGAQAVLLVYSERGDLLRHVDYQDVKVRRA